jgi:hypothetical protein
MKKLLSFLLLLVTANSFAQQVIIKENKDTLVLTTVKKTKVTSIKVGVITYKDSTVSTTYDTTIQTLKVYNPPTTNQPPIARAGTDGTITLPNNSMQLNGSASTDPEGATLNYFWRKVSGPAATLTDTNKVICNVTNMVEGIYDFELRAVDPLNAFTADHVIITVQKATSGGASFPFNLTKNTAFKPRKFSGTEDWNGQYYTSFTGGPQDKYFRFCWTDIEQNTQANYVWTRFDQEFNKAIALKGKFSFGIMIVCDSDDFLREEIINGASSRYPRYVHENMQTQAVKDYAKNGQWIPNWNSTFMLDRFDALLVAIQAHIVSKGWQDKINYVDIRGYGQWGEWHSVGFGQPVTSQPTGTRITVSSYKRFIDGHIKAFPNYQLVMLMAALDANWLDNTMTPPEVTDYILKAKNNVGLIGIRRDQWGATDNYIHDYFENNNRSWNGGPAFKTTIMERYKFAPMVGEPMGPGSNLSDLPRQVTFYHANSVGNGNYTADATSQNYFRTAENNAGYKLALQSGAVETTSSKDLTINFSVENFGNNPCYEAYDLVYELRTTIGTVAWTSTSTFHPALKDKGVHSIIDIFTVPNITLGTTYTLVASFKNSYRTMPLFNNNQNTDGTLLLTNVKF